jgi:hypothetical protein
LVDSEVSSFSQLSAAPASATYRFERLPSQQSHGERQAKLEGVAEAALKKFNFQRLADRDPAAAAFSVQIGARSVRFDRGLGTGLPAWGLGVPQYGVTANGQLVALQSMPRAEPPFYKREVTLLLRDLASNRVVYETHAAHEGVWSDNDAVLPAMFDSALAGFPSAPQGVRRVNVEIPR